MSSVPLSHELPKSEANCPAVANEFYILAHPFKSILCEEQGYNEFSTFNSSDQSLGQSVSIQGHYSEVLDRLASSLDSPSDFSTEIFLSRGISENARHGLFHQLNSYDTTPISFRATFRQKSIMSCSNETLFEHPSDDSIKYAAIEAKYIHSISSIKKNPNYNILETFNSPFPGVKKDKCINTKEKFVCPVNSCNKEFTRKANCRAHMETHNPHRHRPFICSKCCKSYLRSIDLMRHIETSHEMTQKHCCKDCGRTFTRKEGLKKHKERANCLKFC